MLDISDLLATKVKYFKENEFLYLNYAVSESNEYFTPYGFE